MKYVENKALEQDLKNITKSLGIGEFSEIIDYAKWLIANSYIPEYAVETENLTLFDFGESDALFYFWVFQEIANEKLRPNNWENGALAKYNDLYLKKHGNDNQSIYKKIKENNKI